MPVKITAFEAENVKRVKAVALEPSESGLTVIGGRNAQGKTSVLDAIAWALGGDKRRPSEPRREGSATDPHLRVTLSNGLVVERKGKASALKVIDPEGRKSGQSLLNGFVSDFALDLPRFMGMTEREKAKAMLDVIGVGDRLAELEAEEQTLYNQRRAIGTMRDQKQGAADEMTTWPDAPAEAVSVAELVQRQQGILARNGQRQQWRREHEAILDDVMRTQDAIEDAKRRLHELEAKLRELEERDRATQKSPAELAMESTAEIEASIASIEATNEKVRANMAKAAAQAEADELDGQYRDMSASIEAVRARKMALLEGADLPLEGLTVEGGTLLYHGDAWDCMSGSDQLMVATAIARRINPRCGFVLVDKLEQMDVDTLRAFGEWAQGQGLQVIGTRVSTGDECSIVIEDGYGGGFEQSDVTNAGNPFREGQAILDAGVIVPEPATSPKWVM